MTRISRIRRAEEFTAWGMMLPWFLGFLLLTFVPFVVSFYWSFCNYDMLRPPAFVGWANYARIVAEVRQGNGVGRALWNTFYFAILSVPLSVVLGVTLAAFLSWQVKGQAFYRTLCYLPTVVPVVATSILWMELLDPRDGLVNQVLTGFGLSHRLPGWFNDYREAAWLPAWWRGEGGLGSKDAMVLMSLWGVGNMMVIYLAAFRDVPGDIWEAAALDGAGRFTRLWYVGLPLITPVILFNLVMGWIQAVQAFTQFYVVSDGTGSPERSLLVLSLHIFLSAFSDLEMGYASAVAWITLVVLLVATGLLFRSARGWVFYAGTS